MATNDRQWMRNYMYWKNWFMKSKKRKAENASRKRARYKMEKAWKVKKFDGKEVDHKNSNPNNNWDKNLRVVSRKTNRKKGIAKANKNMWNKYK